MHIKRQIRIEQNMHIKCQIHIESNTHLKCQKKPIKCQVNDINLDFEKKNNKKCVLQRHLEEKVIFHICPEYSNL